jgi:hypothetical protein
MGPRSSVKTVLPIDFDAPKARRLTVCTSIPSPSVRGRNSRRPLTKVEIERAECRWEHWCLGRESYGITDTTNRCLSLVWWREHLHCGATRLHHLREIRPPTPRSEATVCAVTKGNIAELEQIPQKVSRKGFS